MRNTILALVTVASLTFAAPAFAAGECYPCLGSSSSQGAVGSPPPHGSFYRTMYESSYQVPPGHVRHARSYHSGYRYHG